MFSRRKVKTLVIVSILYFTMSLSVIFAAEVQAAPSDNYFFKLRILYQSNSDSSNVANLLAQELRRIRIDSTLLSYPGGAFESAVLSKDFDVVFVEIEWPNSDVDPTYIFNTESAANYWGITSTMNGSLENNAYLKAGQLEIDGSTRISIYHDWQDNLMDKILPIIPLYNDITSYSAWGTLDGWNHEKGIIASLPYMEWSSKHYGQDNTSVFIDYADEWNILNPLFIEDTMLASLVSEPLLRIDSAGAPQSVLAENWSFNTNKTILTITLRDNIYWQPDADLVYPSELFTTNDVAFSLQMYQNISTIGSYYRWVKDMVLESSSVIHLIIDGDKDTPGLQSYAPALNELDKLMLPEHYLNVSLDIHGLPDTTHDNWGDYSENGLGTGMYYLKHYSEGVEGVFRSNDDWWGTRADAFNDDLDITEYRVRFLPDLTTKMLEYESGALDIFKDYREYMDYYAASPYQLQTRTEYDVTYIGFNLQSDFAPEIADLTLCEDESMSKGLAVRKAIAHMVDKTAVEGMLDIEFDIINSPLSNKFGSYVDSGITSYDPNLETAKTYMMKAGFDPSTLPTPGFSFTTAILSTFVVATITLTLRKRNK